ncbi:MAG: extracellular solute-binding protein [Burkholderiaceae bacterium]|nr:extracellular solute-binding protein [Burkholderiaceae bacterium]
MKPLLASILAAGLIAVTSAANSETELRVYMPQGVVKAVETHIAPIMREKYDTRVVITPSLSGQSLTKAVAQRASPEISVFLLDEGPWLQGKQAGLWDKLEGVSTLEQIPPRFKDADGMGSAFLLYLLGIIYDEKALAAAGVAPPVSYDDLWNPALKGKVTIPDSTSTFAYALLFKINELQGADARKSLDPGFARLEQLRPNVGVFHGGASTLIPLFSQQQASVGFNASFPAQRLAADGLPIRWIAPKEGAIAIASYVAIARNAPAREAARRFVELLLSPEYQSVQTETAYGGYVNPGTKLREEFAKTFLVKPEDIERASLMPWDLYLSRRQELNARWQRQVESK